MKPYRIITKAGEEVVFATFADLIEWILGENEDLDDYD